MRWARWNPVLEEIAVPRNLLQQSYKTHHSIDTVFASARRLGHEALSNSPRGQATPRWREWSVRSDQLRYAADAVRTKLLAAFPEVLATLNQGYQLGLYVPNTAAPSEPRD